MNLKNIKISTWIRTILQFLAYVNQAIAIMGQTSWASAVWYQWASLGVTVAITVFTYWYNNDWTNLAQSTGEIYDMVKDGELTQEELADFINKHKKSESK